MNERAKYRGKLALAQDEELKLEVKAQGLVMALRDNLDPIEDPGRLHVDVIGQQSLDLHQAVIELRAKREEIAQIRRILED